MGIFPNETLKNLKLKRKQDIYQEAIRRPTSQNEAGSKILQQNQRM